jgi:hypothetical protein
VAGRRAGDSLILRGVAVAWLAMVAGALLIGAFGGDALRAHAVEDGPSCLFKWVTGVDCAFCGMTHATVALGAGDWGAAHRAHPLAIVVLVGSVVIVAMVAAGRGPSLMRGRRPLAILSAIVALWAVRLLVG